MPAVVIPAVIAGAGSLAAGTTTFLGLSVGLLGAAALNFGSTLIFGALQEFAFGTSGKGGGGIETPGFQPISTRAQQRTQQIRQAITSRRLLVGEARVSGPLVFAESTDDNRFLHLVVFHGEGPFTEIGEGWLDDQPVFDDDLDGSGNVTAGKFADKVRIKKHLGATDQAADSDLVSETSATSSFRARGVAYSYVRLEFDQDLFPTAIPNYSAWCKGPAVTDTRDDAAKWTPNATLQLRGYMVAADPGLSSTTDEFDDDTTDASANTSDEIVAVAAGVSHTVSNVDTTNDLLELNGDLLELQTGDRVDVTSTGSAPAGTGADMFVIVKRRKATDHKDIAIQVASSLANAYAGTAADITDAGSGTITVTKSGEPRYTANGVIETDRAPNAIMDDLLSAMDGWATNIGGTWRISPGHYVAPTVTLDESHLRSNIKPSTRHSRRQRFNAVKGVYVTPLNQGQPTDLPLVTDSTFESEDKNERIYTDAPRPFTTRPHTGQRLNKRKLRRHRKQITFTADWSLHALQVQAGSTVAITNSILSWSAKPFLVAKWRFKVVEQQDEAGDPVPELRIEMTLREIDATVDAWTSAEEAAVAPVPPTNLPDPTVVAAPTTLAVTTEKVKTLGNDELGYIVFSWATPSDYYILNGGAFEAQFKRSDAMTWSESWSIEGSKTSLQIGPLQLGIKYDVRVRARNYLGVRSAWSQLSGFTLGAPSSGATVTQDWGLYSGASELTVDWGTFSESADTAFDWETFV